MLKPVKKGCEIQLNEEARTNPLFVVLEGALSQGSWTLRCGDTAGYRNDKRWTKRRLVVAVEDSLVAHFEAEDAAAVLQHHDRVCWTPELAREIMRNDQPRNKEDVAAIEELLLSVGFVQQLPSDVRTAAARFWSLETLKPGNGQGHLRAIQNDMEKMSRVTHRFDQKWAFRGPFV